MAKKVYQAEIGKESKTAKAIIKNANISLKYSTEISNQVKGMYLDRATAWLERIAAHEDYLPLLKYNKKVAHRKGSSTNGVKSGRYPEKAIAKYLELFALVKNNADFKGLDAEKLNIIHMFASKGMTRHSYQSNGKIAGKARRVNATHIEVIVSEVKA
jgi:large subunit ribosomal protein L22